MIAILPIHETKWNFIIHPDKVTTPAAGEKKADHRGRLVFRASLGTL
jgi:hypothetical protein